MIAWQLDGILGRNRPLRFDLATDLVIVVVRRGIRLFVLNIRDVERELGFLKQLIGI